MDQKLELDARSPEEKLLHCLRNFTEVQRRYGIERQKGKFVIADRGKLDRIFESQPELKPILRRLWTDVERASSRLTHCNMTLPNLPSDKSPTGRLHEDQEGADRGCSQGVDRT